MGGPKALMDVGGRPWWRWQMERLDAAGLESVWVVSEDVRDTMEEGGADAEWFAMGDGDEPMFDSVVAGVSALEDEDDVRGVFILPVDVPAPRAPVWEELASAGPVVVPTFEGKHGHPLYLSWGWVEERVLPVRAHAEQYRLDAMIRAEVREVDVDDPSVTMNLNTPEDVKRWLAA
jgi:CTP:molybdopterin cytidylyltransferase MocA